MEILNIERFAEETAALLIEAASLLEGLPPRDPAGSSRWTEDRREWARLYGEGELEPVDGTVAGPAGLYLYELTHLLGTVAELLRAGRVTATLDPLVRAAMERAARINWLLDSGVTGSQRAARAALERAVCLAYYVDSAQQIDDPSANSHKPVLVEQVAQMKQRFNVVDKKAPLDGSLPARYVARLRVDGETYPTLTVTARLALGSRLEADRARGLYGHLSGFTHPNFVFSRNHFATSATGGVVFDYSAGQVKKVTWLALLSFGVALTHFTGYFGLDHDLFNARLASLYNRHKALSAGTLATD